MANFYTVTKEINGVEYKAQFNGIGAALQAVDNTYIDDSSNTSIYKLAKYLFDHVIVEPRISFKDFDGDKVGEEVTKVIGGVEYTARYKGIETAVKAIDSCYIDGSKNISTEKLAEYLFSKIIVEPKQLSVNDFDSMEDFNEVVSFARETMQGGDIMKTFNEVVAFARDVMQGNFRDEADKKPTKAKSQK